MRISAALIVRDEAAHLPACLASIADIADEIVVVDTGSRDRSPEIAREFGARLVREPWRDDFAHARNVALSHATGEWVLYIDADERAASTGDLRGALDDATAVAAWVRFRASSRVTPYREHRLFRNRPDIRFRGVIHETVLPDIEAIREREGLRVVAAPLAIDHLGYEGDLTPKHRRNLPLLRRAVADDPGRIFLSHALAEAELGLGNAGAAEDCLRRALERVRRRAPLPGDALLYADLLDLHFAHTALSDAAALAAEAAARHPDDPLVLWWRARQLEACDELDAARRVLERLLECGSKGPPPGALAYDRGLFGPLTWALLGVCWLREGEPERALEWLRRAEAASPGDAEIRVKRELAEGMAKNRRENRRPRS